MKLNNDDWQDALIALNFAHGAMDAERGVLDPPRQNRKAKYDENEIYAYWRGFEARRKELGDKFKWATASPARSATPARE